MTKKDLIKTIEKELFDILNLVTQTRKLQYKKKDELCILLRRIKLVEYHIYKK